MALVRSVQGTSVRPLAAAWRCTSVAPDALNHPDGFAGAACRWIDAVVPGTAAKALEVSREWTRDSDRDFDADDWWFRTTVDVAPRALDERVVLRLGGLATLADVWLDGRHLLHSDNMFVEHGLDITNHTGPGELVLRFASIANALKTRRPRGRWRTQLVAEQQLRWIRTTLLGRIPAWAPGVAPVGPYREIAIERGTIASVTGVDITTRVEGRDGHATARLRVAPIGSTQIARVVFEIGGQSTDLTCDTHPDGSVIASGTLRIPDVSLWWPATHGTPALLGVAAVVITERGAIRVDLGRTGFRTITLDREDGGFCFVVNGVRVFTRGAAWTPLDPVWCHDTESTLRPALEAAARSGMNMLRVGGTMGYATQAFHDLCDALGILVWQDFMFANMDYPAADPAFTASVELEATQLMDRLQLSPSLAVACGGSEVAQQAAMLGFEESYWSSSLFREQLPAIVKTTRPDLPYVANTPDGGPLPFHVSEGLSHYYGVGAYLRPIDDARRARVRFTSECLAFSNVPCDETIEHVLRNGEAAPTHSRWKARVPRDRGASWDFEDVRDHYLRRLFDVDSTLLRTGDAARYLELGRVVTGEAMLGAVSEWRRAGSSCQGSLVWLLRDFLPGAGWGVFDAFGRPKAAARYLARAFAPVALLVTDEGLNGLSFHAVNDQEAALDADLHVTLYRDAVRIAHATTVVGVPAHSVVETPADAVLGRFVDMTYAYRFGPAGHDVVVGTLIDRQIGTCLGRAFHFPQGYPHTRVSDLGVAATGEPAGANAWRVTVRTTKLAMAVAFDRGGYLADDEFFHIEPGGERTVLIQGDDPRVFPSRVMPLNATHATSIEFRHGGQPPAGR